MKTLHHILACLLVCSARGDVQGAPADFAFWLEQVPGTNDVLVVARSDVDGVGGWSWGVCHDPGKATLVDCIAPVPCESVCPTIECPADLLSPPGPVGPGPPEFLSVQIHENGITQGAVFIRMGFTMSRVDRFEMLKISYTPGASEASLEFCDTLGVPAVGLIMVHGGASFRPASMRGAVVSFQGAFVRGDVNADGALNVADPVYLLRYLLLGGQTPPCLNAGDGNNDDRVDIADGVAIIRYLFRGAAALPEPFEACGFDETGGRSQPSCQSYAPCS